MRGLQHAGLGGSDPVIGDVTIPVAACKIKGY
jgi:hypothetical protein